MNTLSLNQQAALDKFEKSYVVKKGDANALKTCVELNIDPEFIYNIIIYHKDAKEFTKFGNTHGWNSLTKHHKLPERFIRDNIDKFNWDDLCTYQNLSEEFIAEFCDKVNWTILFLRQDIEFSPEFLYQFQNVIKKSIINTLHTKTVV